MPGRAAADERAFLIDGPSSGGDGRGRIGGEMSALVVIVCDQCGDTGTMGHTPHEARAELSAWARRGGLDLCPLCRLLTESHDRLEAAAG
ncbi:MAG: hypothetical protein ACRDTT_06850 [Pseudonocardiaceae bacterium]